MKLPTMLLKAGLASAGAGIYLYFRKLFKTDKKTKKGSAKNLKQTRTTKKKIVKPRQKKSPAIES